jgi:DNA-directed RNA polymerase specialized sigma24 family protein
MADSSAAALWQRARSGDRDAFEEAVAPHRDALLRASRTAIDALRASGDLREDALHPQELVGETLVRAFDGRDRYDPRRLGLRAWLLGLQQRALRRITSDEARYHNQKAISLDEEVPFNGRYDHVEESFYEFNDPFDVTTYEELIPAQTPMDVEFHPHGPLTEEERARLAEADISPQHRQVIELHDEFELSLSEVAQILERSLHDVAEDVGSARVHVRQWLGSTDVHDVTGDDSVDSYTGEPTDANPAFAGERGPTAGEPAETPLERAARDATPGATE